MNKRLAHAESITGETIEKYAREWQVAASEVAANPAFKKLDLAPQVGLIPLGKDAGSGLQEFAHLPSGQPAVRDPKTGKLVITEATGIVLVLVPGDTFMTSTPRRWMTTHASTSSRPCAAPGAIAPWPPSCWASTAAPCGARCAGWGWSDPGIAAQEAPHHRIGGVLSRSKHRPAKASTSREP